MRKKCLKLLTVLILGMSIAAPSVWADKTAYGYVISYSYRDKVAYHSQIFENRIEGRNYNSEEYVIETQDLLKLESAFQKQIASTYRLNPMNLTTSARAAFKTLAIAKEKLDQESRDFMFKGLKIKEVLFNP